MTPRLDPGRFTLGNYERWLKEPDPWKDVFRHKQSLAAVMRAGRRTS